MGLDVGLLFLLEEEGAGAEEGAAEGEGEDV